MRKTATKRFLALILAFAMILGNLYVVPITAEAAQGGDTANVSLSQAVPGVDGITGEWVTSNENLKLKVTITPSSDAAYYGYANLQMSAAGNSGRSLNMMKISDMTYESTEEVGNTEAENDFANINIGITGLVRDKHDVTVQNQIPGVAVTPERSELLGTGEQVTLQFQKQDGYQWSQDASFLLNGVVCQLPDGAQYTYTVSNDHSADETLVLTNIEGNPLVSNQGEVLIDNQIPNTTLVDGTGNPITTGIQAVAGEILYLYLKPADGYEKNPSTTKIGLNGIDSDLIDGQMMYYVPYTVIEGKQKVTLTQLDHSQPFAQKIPDTKFFANFTNNIPHVYPQYADGTPIGSAIEGEIGDSVLVYLALEEGYMPQGDAPIAVNGAKTTVQKDGSGNLYVVVNLTGDDNGKTIALSEFQGSGEGSLTFAVPIKCELTLVVDERFEAAIYPDQSPSLIWKNVVKTEVDYGEDFYFQVNAVGKGSLDILSVTGAEYQGMNGDRAIYRVEKVTENKRIVIGVSAEADYKVEFITPEGLELYSDEACTSSVPTSIQMKKDQEYVLYAKTAEGYSFAESFAAPAGVGYTAVVRAAKGNVKTIAITKDTEGPSTVEFAAEAVEKNAKYHTVTFSNGGDPGLYISANASGAADKTILAYGEYPDESALGFYVYPRIGYKLSQDTLTVSGGAELKQMDPDGAYAYLEIPVVDKDMAITVTGAVRDTTQDSYTITGPGTVEGVTFDLDPDTRLAGYGEQVVLTAILDEGINLGNLQITCNGVVLTPAKQSDIVYTYTVNNVAADLVFEATGYTSANQRTVLLNNRVDGAVISVGASDEFVTQINGYDGEYVTIKMLPEKEGTILPVGVVGTVYPNTGVSPLKAYYFDGEAYYFQYQINGDREILFAGNNQEGVVTQKKNLELYVPEGLTLTYNDGVEDKTVDAKDGYLRQDVEVDYGTSLSFSVKLSDADKYKISENGLTVNSIGAVATLTENGTYVVENITEDTVVSLGGVEAITRSILLNSEEGIEFWKDGSLLEGQNLEGKLKEGEIRTYDIIPAANYLLDVDALNASTVSGGTFVSIVNATEYHATLIVKAGTEDDTITVGGTKSLEIPVIFPEYVEGLNYSGDRTAVRGVNYHFTIEVKEGYQVTDTLLSYNGQTVTPVEINNSTYMYELQVDPDQTEVVLSINPNDVKAIVSDVVFENNVSGVVVADEAGNLITNIKDVPYNELITFIVQAEEGKELPTDLNVVKVDTGAGNEFATLYKVDKEKAYFNYRVTEDVTLTVDATNKEASTVENTVMVSVPEGLKAVFTGAKSVNGSDTEFTVDAATDEVVRVVVEYGKDMAMQLSPMDGYRIQDAGLTVTSHPEGITETIENSTYVLADVKAPALVAVNGVKADSQSITFNLGEGIKVTANAKVGNVAAGDEVTDKITDVAVGSYTFKVEPKDGYELIPGEFKVEGAEITVAANKNEATITVTVGEADQVVTITGAKSNIFTVSLPGYVEGASFFGSPIVQSGDTYTMDILLEDGYKIDGLTVKCNGQVVPMTGNGRDYTCTVNNVESDLVFTTEGAPTKENYHVTFNVAASLTDVEITDKDGAVISNIADIPYGDTVYFTVKTKVAGITLPTDLAVANDDNMGEKVFASALTDTEKTYYVKVLKDTQVNIGTSDQEVSTVSNDVTVYVPEGLTVDISYVDVDGNNNVKDNVTAAIEVVNVKYGTTVQVTAEIIPGYAISEGGLSVTATPGTIEETQKNAVYLLRDVQAPSYIAINGVEDALFNLSILAEDNIHVATAGDITDGHGDTILTAGEQVNALLRDLLAGTTAVFTATPPAGQEFDLDNLVLEGATPISLAKDKVVFSVTMENADKNVRIAGTKPATYQVSFQNLLPNSKVLSMDGEEQLTILKDVAHGTVLNFRLVADEGYKLPEKANIRIDALVENGSSAITDISIAYNQQEYLITYTVTEDVLLSVSNVEAPSIIANAVSAYVQEGITATFTGLMQSASMTITGKNPVANEPVGEIGYGSDLTVAVEVGEDYRVVEDGLKITLINGDNVIEPAQDNTFHILDVRKPITVRVSGVEKLPVYSINLPTINAAAFDYQKDLAGEDQKTVKENESYEFTMTKNPGFENSIMDVTANLPLEIVEETATTVKYRIDKVTENVVVKATVQDKVEIKDDHNALEDYTITTTDNDVSEAQRELLAINKAFMVPTITPVTYTITLNNPEKYTQAQDQFKLTYTDVNGADQPIAPVKTGDGVYTFTLTTEGNAVISTGQKLPADVYTVTSATTNSKDIQIQVAGDALGTNDNEKVTYGDDFEFTLAPVAGAEWIDMEKLVVKANGTQLQLTDNNSYVIGTVTEDQEITIENLQKKEYTITIPVVENITVTPAAGLDVKTENGKMLLTVQHGDSFKFTVVGDADNDVEVRAIGIFEGNPTGENKEITNPDRNSSYEVKDIQSDLEILTVTEYVTGLTKVDAQGPGVHTELLDYIKVRDEQGNEITTDYLEFAPGSNPRFTVSADEDSNGVQVYEKLEVYIDGELTKPSIKGYYQLPNLSKNHSVLIKAYRTQQILRVVTDSDGINYVDPLTGEALTNPEKKEAEVTVLYGDKYQFELVRDAGYSFSRAELTITDVLANSNSLAALYDYPSTGRTGYITGEVKAESRITMASLDQVVVKAPLSVLNQMIQPYYLELLNDNQTTVTDQELSVTNNTLTFYVPTGKRPQMEVTVPVAYAKSKATATVNGKAMEIYKHKETTNHDGDKECGLYYFSTAMGKALTGNTEIVINGVVKNTYSVSLPKDTGITARPLPGYGSYRVEYDQDFKFTLTPNFGYTQSKLVVSVWERYVDSKGNVSFVQKQTLTPSNGVYTIKNIKANQYVKVTGIKKNVYTVNFTVPTGATVKNVFGYNMNSVVHGNTYKFTVKLEKAYNLSPVKVKNIKTNQYLTPDKNGVYTLTNITDFRYIKILGVRLNVQIIADDYTLSPGQTTHVEVINVPKGSGVNLHNCTPSLASLDSEGNLTALRGGTVKLIAITQENGKDVITTRKIKIAKKYIDRNKLKGIFNVGGINYKITEAATDKSKGTVAVANNQDNDRLTANPVIPECIKYKGKQYKVTSISASAFYDVHSLRSISIPKTVTTISSTAFVGANNLTQFYVASKNRYYGAGGAMLMTKGGRQLVAYPSARGKVVIPTEITKIRAYAMSDTRVTEIVIGKQVTSIDICAFSHTDKLRKITFKNRKASSLACSCVLSATRGNCKVYVPKKSLKDYKKLLRGGEAPRSISIKGK